MKALSLLIFLYVFSALGITHSPIIGYGSSDAVLPAKNQALFYLGFELGLKNKLGGRNLSDILTVEQISDGSPLGASQSANRLIAKNVLLLVGFPTSHEALLASEVAKNNQMLSIFSGASHSKLSEKGPLIFTTGERMSDSAKSILSFILLNMKQTKGIMISNPQAVFSMDLERTILSELKKTEFSQVQLLPMYLTKELILDDNGIKQVKKADYLCVTSYADESISLLNQLTENKIDIPIVSNSSWTTGDIEYIRRLLSLRKSPLYSFSLWIKGSPASIDFEKSLRSQYGMEPTSEVAFGYDLGIIAGTVLNKTGKNPTKAKMIRKFHEIKCFDGTTSGTLCFSPKGGHAKRTLFPVRYTKTGFVPIL